MAKARLSKKAADELDAITTYTAEQFGRSQAITYTNALTRALDLIADNPHIGRDYGADIAGLRRLPVRRHVIYYEIDEEGVLIQRILHHAQDPMRQFDGAGD